MLRNVRRVNERRREFAKPKPRSERIEPESLLASISGKREGVRTTGAGKYQKKAVDISQEIVARAKEVDEETQRRERAYSNVLQAQEDRMRKRIEAVFHRHGKGK